jgi:hypothetical protein
MRIYASAGKELKHCREKASNKGLGFPQEEQEMEGFERREQGLGSIDPSRAEILVNLAEICAEICAEIREKTLSNRVVEAELSVES